MLARPRRSAFLAKFASVSDRTHHGRFDVVSQCETDCHTRGNTVHTLAHCGHSACVIEVVRITGAARSSPPNCVTENHLRAAHDDIVHSENSAESGGDLLRRPLTRCESEAHIFIDGGVGLARLWDNWVRQSSFGSQRFRDFGE